MCKCHIHFRLVLHWTSTCQGQQENVLNGCQMTINKVGPSANGHLQILWYTGNLSCSDFFNISILEDYSEV